MDRNVNIRVVDGSKSSSLSARRAWIEIFVPFDVIRPAMSLSARRAWIEICGGVSARPLAAVALRKESGDRNVVTFNVIASRVCRSPQGERG